MSEPNKEAAGSEPIHPGLEGVLAGESAICDVEETTGGLLYRGYRIEALAESASFEEVAYLLLIGKLPNRKELSDFSTELAAARPLPGTVRRFLKSVPRDVNPMDFLRTAVSFLGLEDPDRSVNEHPANLRKAIRLIAQIPSLLAAFRSAPQAPPPPDPELSHAANLLYLITGSRPDPFSAKVMEVSLILYAEHEFNASTFAARVTASSLSDLHSAVTSAIGSLKGPLHGGANEAVMKMLLEIGGSEQADRYIGERLARKERIMGFGHRVLKSGDPRSDIIKKYACTLGEQKNDRSWFDLSSRIEEKIRREKGLYPNLDFYSASAYYLLGLPIEFDTPLFVCSRIAGWSAHVMEQHDHNRLIRPRCRYTGPGERPYLPIASRS
ncbi:MAG: citrate synthase [Nitrospirae bacterium]|nr:citrate synthase [Candidatus Manganitrophaceae bacterium]